MCFFSISLLSSATSKNVSNNIWCGSDRAHSAVLPPPPLPTTVLFTIFVTRRRAADIGSECNTTRNIKGVCVYVLSCGETEGWQGGGRISIQRCPIHEHAIIGSTYVRTTPLYAKNSDPRGRSASGVWGGWGGARRIGGGALLPPPPSFSSVHPLLWLCDARGTIVDRLVHIRLWLSKKHMHFIKTS